jgi:hypothetical protein
VQDKRQKQSTLNLRKRGVLWLFILFLLNSAYPQIPKMITYQGLLTDDNGNPRPTGRYDFIFSLFTDSSGGNSLWTQTEQLQVQNGIFVALLGSKTILNLPFKSPYWLAVSVDGKSLLPRTRLTSIAYCFMADTANYAINSYQSRISDSARYAYSNPFQDSTRASRISDTAKIAILCSIADSARAIVRKSVNANSIELGSISDSLIAAISWGKISNPPILSAFHEGSTGQWVKVCKIDKQLKDGSVIKISLTLANPDNTSWTIYEKRSLSSDSYVQSPAVPWIKTDFDVAYRITNDIYGFAVACDPACTNNATFANLKVDILNER